MHIYHINQSSIHSAIQSLNHSLSHLEASRREYCISEAIESANDATNGGLPKDFLKLIHKPSKQEGLNALSRALNEAESALVDIKKAVRHHEETALEEIAKNK